MKNVKLLTLILVPLFFLSACHRARYSALNRIENRQQCKDHQGFEVAVKALSVEETKDFFGTNLISKGFQPLQVEMNNTSKDVYAISGNYIELPLAPEYMVRGDMHYDTFNFTWTTSLLSAIYFFPLLPVIIYSSYSMHDYNKAIDAKVHDFTLSSEELVHINPGEIITKIVFVHGLENARRFALGFLNLETKEVIKMNFNC